jgi:hypothetical protein
MISVTNLVDTQDFATRYLHVIDQDSAQELASCTLVISQFVRFCLSDSKRKHVILFLETDKFGFFSAMGKIASMPNTVDVFPCIVSGFEVSESFVSIASCAFDWDSANATPDILADICCFNCEAMYLFGCRSDKEKLGTSTLNALRPIDVTSPVDISNHLLSLTEYRSAIVYTRKINGFVAKIPAAHATIFQHV